MAAISLRCLSIENLRGSVTPFVLQFEKGKKPITDIIKYNTNDNTLASISNID